MAAGRKSDALQASYGCYAADAARRQFLPGTSSLQDRTGWPRTGGNGRDRVGPMLASQQGAMSNDVPTLVVAPAAGLPVAPSERVQAAARIETRRNVDATRGGGGFDQALDRADAAHLPIGKDSAVDAIGTPPTISGLFNILKPGDQTSGLTGQQSSLEPVSTRSAQGIAAANPAPVMTHRSEPAKPTKVPPADHSDTTRKLLNEIQPDPANSLVTPAIMPLAPNAVLAPQADVQTSTYPVTGDTVAKAGDHTFNEATKSLPAAAPPSLPDIAARGLVNEVAMPAGRPAQLQTGKTTSARAKPTTDSAVPHPALGSLMASPPSPAPPPVDPHEPALAPLGSSVTSSSAVAATPKVVGAIGAAHSAVANDTRPSSKMSPARRGSASADAPRANAPPAATAAPVVATALVLAPSLPNGLQAASVAAAATPATSIAAQVAPALISLINRKDGSNEMTVSLHPRDLGQVDIRIARASDGSTVVTVTASQPQTLQDLASNVHHLHAALDAANIPVDSRTLNFVAPLASDPGQQFQSGSSGSNASTTQDQGSNTPGYQQQGSHRPSQGRPATGTGGYDSASPVVMRRSWQISGLNITA